MIMDKVYVNPETKSIQYEESLDSIELDINKEVIEKWNVNIIKSIIDLVLSIKDKTDHKRHKWLYKKILKLEELKNQLLTK